MGRARPYINAAKITISSLKGFALMVGETVREG